MFHIVKDAALRAGLPEETSPHWLHDAHGMHTLKHKVPIQLVKETLGYSNIAVTQQLCRMLGNDDSSAYFLPTF